MIPRASKLHQVVISHRKPVRKCPLGQGAFRPLSIQPYSGCSWKQFHGQNLESTVDGSTYSLGSHFGASRKIHQSVGMHTV